MVLKVPLLMSRPTIVAENDFFAPKLYSDAFQSTVWRSKHQLYFARKKFLEILCRSSYDPYYLLGMAVSGVPSKKGDRTRYDSNKIFLKIWPTVSTLKITFSTKLRVIVTRSLMKSTLKASWSTSSCEKLVSQPSKSFTSSCVFTTPTLQVTRLIARSNCSCKARGVERQFCRK